ncbi:tape measure protein [Lactococcus kimchii]|uniref:tape measure protein n=1 Tax=Lactococcus sp. S-13 TaxID=2507158 RepID=UPI0010239074|nr:tape measure protein [Lactococcus sp. S-13]RZI48420.1 hypothetical protein EQJ87_02550 [Lactococcus sp. S-13]
MNELFKILGTIAIDGSDVDNELNKAVGSAESSGGKFKSILQGIGMGIGNMIVQGAQKIASFAGEAMNASDALNKYTSTMKFAGFKDADINRSRNVFKKYADDTVYDLETITNTGAQLAANGIKNFQSLTLSAGNLNAVAGGNADTFKSVAMVMTQTAGAGKLTTENWNQMADAIPGASGMLQKAMKDNGAYTGNFRDAMAAGQITADEFNQAIEELGNKPVAVEAAKSTKTFEGAIGNMQASVVTGLNNVIDALGKGGMTNAITQFGSGVEGAFNKVVTWVNQGKKLIGEFQDRLKENGAIDSFKQLFSSVQIAIGTVKDIIGQLWQSFTGGTSSKDMMKGLADAAKTLSDKLTNAVNNVGAFLTKISNNGSVQKFADTIKAVGVALFTGVAALKGYQIALAAMKVVQTVQLAFFAFFNVLQNGGTVLKAAQVALKLFNVTLMANPIPIIITAIAALVAGLIYFFTQTKTGQAIWQNFMNWLKSAWQAIAQFFSNLWDGIVDTFNTVVNSLKEVWESVTSFFSGLWDDITNIFTTAVNSISNFVVPIFNSIASGIQMAMNIIWSVIQIVWQLIKATFELVVGGIVAYIKWAGDIWVSIIRTAMDAIHGIITSVWNAIKPFVMSVVNGIKNIITTVWNAIATSITTVMTTVSNQISAIWNAIRNVFSAVVGWISSFIAREVENWKNVINTVMNAILAVIVPIWNSVKNTIATAVNAIKNVITSVFNAVKSTVTSIFNSVREIISSVWNSIKTTISNVVNAIKSGVSSGFNTVRNTASSIFSAVSSSISSIWNGIKNAISNTVNSIKGTVSNVFNAIKNAMEAPIRGAQSVISGIIDTIKRLFNFKINFPDITIPKIPMPHFKISGDFNPLKGKIPSIGVDWYAKGGIMDGATIFGMNGNNLQVGGEAGREAILPLTDKVLRQIGIGARDASGGAGDGDGLVFNQYNYSPENIDARTASKYAKRDGKDMLRTLRIRS